MVRDPAFRDLGGGGMTALAFGDNWMFYAFGVFMLLLGVWFLWLGRDA